ncbi:MAG: hypothetical protein ACREDP_19960, partial [Bradyrhizobium sp.]
MRVRRIAGAALASTLALAMAFACVQPGKPGTDLAAAATKKPYDASEWKYWGGDAGQTRYAPLTQINPSNVSRLKVAWRWTA